MSQEMPREVGIDSTLNMLKDGYQFIMKRQDRFDSNVFETRLLGQKAICMVGEEAAEIFFDEDKFQREDAAPNRVKETLFGKGGVQGLDGEAHRHRKKMFMNIMTRENLQRLDQMLQEQWDIALEKWEHTESVVFYEEVQEILTRTACIWAGVPVEENMKELTEDLVSLFESPASVGPPHWIGRKNRNQLEKWMEKIVHDVRAEKIHPAEHTALTEFSQHKDHEGQELPAEIAAVEVLNIIRPIVAISIYNNFLVLALHEHPEEIEKLKSADSNYAKMFIQEVRRHYPFFPFITAKVKEDFTWKGYEFEEGTMTILDLYGTNHHPDHWDNPDTFYPERFNNWEGSPFSFIPQGGGDHYLGHRCAGESVILSIMQTSLDYLVSRMDYNLPEQDLELSMNDIPSVPKSKIIMQDVRRV